MTERPVPQQHRPLPPHIGCGRYGQFHGSLRFENAGTGKTLTPTGTVNDGNGGANYNVSFVNNTTGVITAKGLTVTGITANSKTFDGTTAAILNTGSAALVGVVAGDVVTLNTAGATGTLPRPMRARVSRSRFRV